MGMIGRETGWPGFRLCPDTRVKIPRAVGAESTTKEATIFADKNRSYLWLESAENPEGKTIDQSPGRRYLRPAGLPDDIHPPRP